MHSCLRNESYTTSPLTTSLVQQETWDVPHLQEHQVHVFFLQGVSISHFFWHLSSIFNSSKMPVWHRKKSVHHIFPIHLSIHIFQPINQAWDVEPSLNSFILLPIDVAVEEGLFGPEAPQPAARARMGDFLGLSSTAKTLVSPKEPWRMRMRKTTGKALENNETN